MKREALYLSRISASFHSRVNHFAVCNCALSLLASLGGVAARPLYAQTVAFAGPHPSVNFGNINLCRAGQTTPAPCSETLPLTYHVTGGGSLGTPKVVTQGAPELDFTLASGSTCVGSVAQGNTCSVNVRFTPLYAGGRAGGVQIVDETGAVLATTLIYGFGIGPQFGFAPGPVISLAREQYNPVQIALDGYRHAGSMVARIHRRHPRDRWRQHCLRRLHRLHRRRDRDATNSQLGLHQPVGFT